MLKKIVFFLFLSSSLVYSETLIISGGGNKSSTRPRYYNMAMKIYEVQMQTSGKTPYFLAEDGQWPIANAKKEKKLYSAESVSNIDAIFKKIGNNLSENLTIFVSDHGGAPLEENDPLSGQIYLYGPDQKAPLSISYKYLKKLIKKYIPKTSKVQLIGVQCYSGGMHHIAFDLPNVCSASSTDFRTPTNSPFVTKKTGQYKMNLYGEGFWLEKKNKQLDKKFNNDKKTSLYEAHIAGVSNDYMNTMNSALSSSRVNA